MGNMEGGQSSVAWADVCFASEKIEQAASCAVCIFQCLSKNVFVGLSGSMFV